MNFKKTVLVSTIATILAGCGGSDSKDTPPANQLPTVSATPITVKSGGDVTVKATATDKDGSIASYKWTVKSGATGLALSGDTTDTVSFKAPISTSDAEIILTITVVDNQGGTSSFDVKVTVQKNLVPTITNENVTAAGNIDFKLSAKAQDSDGSIVSYSWVKKSGPDVVLQGANTADLTFRTPVVATDTTFVFTLTVTDNQGATATKDISVVVSKSTQASVGGVVVKGVLANAALKVFKFVDNKPVLLTPNDILGSLMTDAKGDYNFTVLNYSGPLKITAMAASDGSTTMRCDALEGCLTVNGSRVPFGQDVKLADLDAKLELNTITAAKDGAAIKGNISTLTHLAAELIQKQTTIDTTKISDVKKQLMDTFGIKGELDSLTPIKVDNPQDVAATTNADALRYGLINAAIANALLNGKTKPGEVASLSSRLTAAANDYAQSNGNLRFARDDDDDFELSLEDVLNNAAETSKEVRKKLAEQGLPSDDQIEAKLGAISTEFNSKKNEYKENLGDDGRVVVRPEIPTEGGPLAVARAMVQDVRMFANLVERKGEKGTDFGKNLTEFDDLVSAASDMIKEESDKFALLSELADIAVEIDDANDEDITDAVTYDLKTYTSLPGLVGEAVLDPDNRTLNVTATYQQEKVQIQIKLDDSEDKKTFTLGLSGTVENDKAMLVLSDTSSITLEIDEAFDIDGEINGDTAPVTPLTDESVDSDPTPVSAALVIHGKLAQKATAAVPEPVAFEGKIEVELTARNIAIARFNHDNWYAVDKSWNFEKSFLAVPTEVFLSGEFSTAENAVKVMLTAEVLNADVFDTTGIDGSAEKLPSNLTMSVDSTGNKVKLTAPNSDSYAELVFTPGANANEWSLYRKTEGTDSDDVVSSVTMDQRYSTLASGLDKPTLVFLSNYTFSRDTKTSYQVRYIPIDTNQDKITDTVEAWSLSATILDDNTLVDNQGKPVTFENNAKKLFSIPLAQFIEQNSALFYGNPYEGHTDGRKIIQSLSDDNIFLGYLQIKDVGYVAYDSSALELSQLTPNATLALPGYIAAPYVQGDVKVTVAADGLSSSITMGDAKHSVTAVKVSDSKLTLQSDWREADRHWVEDVTINRVTTNDSLSYLVCEKVNSEYRGLNVIKVSKSGNATTMAFAFFPNGRYSENGMISYGNGSTANVNALTYYASQPYNTIGVVGTCGGTPESSSPARDFMLSYHYKNNAQYRGFIPEMRVEGQGLARMERTKNFSDLVNGNDRNYGAVIIAPDRGDALENEDNFVELAANLTVKTDVEGYELSASLSALRTALEDAEIGLDIQYSLPNSNGVRRFSVDGNLDEDTYVFSNAEGVEITFNNAVLADSNEVEVGTIKVNGVLQAKILRRNSMFLISYIDETVESL